MIEFNIWQIFKSTLSVLWEFWPIWLIFLVLVAIRITLYWIGVEFHQLKNVLKFKKGEKWRSDRDLIQWLRGMNPSEFEEYVANLFRRLGYDTQVVGGVNDGGIDVIAKKDGVEHYIQCKKYFSKHKVGSPELRDFYGAMAGKLANGKGYFITTNKFTLEAEKYAEDKPIELIDEFKLIEYIKIAGEDKKEVGEETTKVCPKCGGSLVKRKGKYGEFYGCSNYPKCRYIKNINSK